jgi:hypothetical protein
MSSLRHFLFAPLALGLLALGGCNQPPVPLRPVNNCQMQFSSSKSALVVPDRLTMTLYRQVNGSETNCKSPKSVIFSVNGVKLSEDTSEPFVFVWEVKPGEPSVPTIGSRDVELKAIATYPGDGAQNTVAFPPIPVKLQVLASDNLVVQP